MLIALWVEIELRFALRSTVSEITAIKVSTLAAILDFSKHLKQLLIALRVAIKLRFALRLTVSEIMAIEVLAKWPLFKTLKYAKQRFTYHMHFVSLGLGNSFRP